MFQKVLNKRVSLIVANVYSRKTFFFIVFHSVHSDNKNVKVLLSNERFLGIFYIKDKKD